MSEVQSHAARLLKTYDSGAQIAPFAQGLGLNKAQAYAISGQIAQLRRDRGERPVGRKIGFTNQTIWEQYGVSGPMWSWMYDTTLAPMPQGPVALPDLPEPRLEPEIAFHFVATPQPGMSVTQIAGCIDWMAHGFEIVSSPFPGWQFALADCIAAQALHGRYWHGPPQPMPAPEVLEDFGVTLTWPGGTRQGHARDVLGGPLHAVRFLLDEIAAMPGAAPIQPGEIITTGTLTDGHPVAAGETWATTFDGIDLPGAMLQFL